MATVSIIVPVYKVEKYLHRCVDSILAQTYTDFECILVDDGSPDNCGKICDEYAAKDSRVKVIHKKNGGLSDARNAGLDICNGNGYVAFVDSDDYIAPEYLEVLMKEMNKTDADIVCFNYYAVYSNNKKVFINTTSDCKYATEEIKNKIIMDYWLNSVWDKFYKAELFKNVRFPNGVLFEDAYTIPKVFYKAKKISCIKNALYFYERSNTGSIVNNFDSRGAYGVMGGWISRLRNFPLNNEQKNYAHSKMIRFGIEAYLFNSVDKKLSSMQLEEVCGILGKEDNVLIKVILKNNAVCKVVGKICQVAKVGKTFLRNNSLVYSVWMKYKTGQRV